MLGCRDADRLSRCRVLLARGTHTPADSSGIHTLPRIRSWPPGAPTPGWLQVVFYRQRYSLSVTFLTSHLGILEAKTEFGSAAAHSCM